MLNISHIWISFKKSCSNCSRISLAFVHSTYGFHPQANPTCEWGRMKGSYLFNYQEGSTMRSPYPFYIMYWSISIVVTTLCAAYWYSYENFCCLLRKVLTPFDHPHSEDCIQGQLPCWCIYLWGTIRSQSSVLLSSVDLLFSSALCFVELVIFKQGTVLSLYLSAMLQNKA